MSKTTFARRRTAALMSVAALATTGLMATAGSAGAAITAGAGVDDLDRPTFYQDAEGVKLALCTGAQCEPADPADPLHGGYFGAEAQAGPFRIVFGIETAAGEDAAGNPTNEAIVANVARFTGRDLRPNGRYVIQHPWGQQVVFADDRGRANVVKEAGGETGTPISRGVVKTFLRRLTAPAGFLGNLETSGPVTGSPTGFNRITVTGPGVSVVQRRFNVTGQMVEDTPMTSVSDKRLTLGSKDTRRASRAAITVDSFGTASAPVRANIVGPNKARFSLNGGVSTLTRTLASGSSMAINVKYMPRANRNSTATLVLRDGNIIRSIPLKGVGFAR